MAIVRIRFWLAWIGVVSITTGYATGAKTPPACAIPVALGALSFAPIPKVGAPYSATVRTTHDQTMEDGSTIHLTITTLQARDAVGRMFNEESFGCQQGADSELHPVIRRFVTDPVSGTTIWWSEGDPLKILHVSHDPPRLFPLPPTTKTRSQKNGRRGMMALGIETGLDLGSKEVAGVIAEGTRITSETTLGHKQIDERWVAKNLELEMLRIKDNSGTGRTITEVVDFKQGDPNLALFDPPAGYVIRDSKLVR